VIRIYVLFSLILVSLIFLSIIWEFILEDYMFSQIINEGELESFEQKIEYVITIFCFGLIALIGPLYMSLKSEKSRVNLETEREKLISDLQGSINEIKRLQGIIPICSYCHSIRNDEGAWHGLESYISKHSEASFSHGICPKCTIAVRKSAGLDVE
jgi:hypothetical protein